MCTVLHTDVVHTLDHCSKNDLCKEVVKTVIILMHGDDSTPFPAHVSLLKISNTQQYCPTHCEVYDGTSQHQNSADILQGNASSNSTELLQTCLGPKRYFYIAAVNSCSCLCLKILGNKLIHFCTLFQSACLMPVHIFRGLILDSFRLRVQPQRQRSQSRLCCNRPCGGTLMQDRLSLRLSNSGLVTLPHRSFTETHLPN